MSLLSKEDILNQPLATEDVDVPEWGGIVRVRELTAKERLELGRSFRQSDEAGQLATYTSLAVGMALVDETGDRLFDNEEMNKLLESSGVVINRLYDVVSRLSGLKSNSEAAVKN